MISQRDKVYAASRFIRVSFSWHVLTYNLMLLITGATYLFNINRMGFWLEVICTLDGSFD